MSRARAVRETRLWQWLSAARKALRDQLHLTRIENSAGLGTPDCEGCYRGRQFWIELKTADRPHDRKTPISVRYEDQQAPWLRRRSRAGGAAYVLLQVGSAHNARRYLVPASQAEDLETGLTESALSEASVCEPTARPEQIVKAAGMGRLNR